MHEIMKSRKIRKIANKWFLFTGIRDKEPSHDRAECILKQSHVKRIVMYTDPPIHDYQTWYLWVGNLFGDTWYGGQSGRTINMYAGYFDYHAPYTLSPQEYLLGKRDVLIEDWCTSDHNKSKLGKIGIWMVSDPL